jgi:hypothetical protein
MAWFSQKIFRKANKLDRLTNRCKIYTRSMFTRQTMTCWSRLTNRSMPTGKRMLFKSKLQRRFRLTTRWESHSMLGGKRSTILIIHLLLVLKISLTVFQRSLRRLPQLRVINQNNLSLRTIKFKKKLHLSQIHIRQKLKHMITQLIIWSLIFKSPLKNTSLLRKQIFSMLIPRSTWQLSEITWMNLESPRLLSTWKLILWDPIKVWHVSYKYPQDLWTS